jgi:hypothetical protein
VDNIVSKAKTEMNIKLMPYPILQTGVAQYIKECAEVIEKNMREIAEIDKYIKESEDDKKKLVSEVIEAKRKICSYLVTNNDQQTLLDFWMQS